MRLIYPLFLAACFCISAPAHAQTADRSLSLGFQTRVRDVQSAGPGRWLALLRGSRQPGELFTDTLALVLFDDAANVVFFHRLELPGEEVSFFHDVAVMPDGGFVYSFESTLCDVANYRTTIGKIDAGGTLQWQFTSAGNGSGFPHLLEALPDGDVLGFDMGQLVKIDGTTGSVLWTAPLVYEQEPVFYLVDFKPVPGTEHIVVLYSTEAQLWLQSGDPDAPEYSVANASTFGSLIYPSQPLEPLVGGGWITFVPENKRFYQITPQAQVMALDLSEAVANVVDYVATDDGILTLERNGTENRLRKFAFAGGVQVYPMPDSNYLPRHLALRGHTAAIAGLDLYGAEPFGFVNSVEGWRAVHAAWLRTIHLAGPGESHLPDVALTAVEQQSAVDVQPVVWGTNVFYQLSGGQYRVQVQNQGAEPITEVYVNLAAPQGTMSFICLGIPAWQQHHGGLNILPGESAWLDFGDINLADEPQIPMELCFSVSSPNRRPDRQHVDNTFCQGIVTAAGEPATGGVALFPNPVSDGPVTLTFSDGPMPASIQVFDAFGRPVYEHPVDGAKTARFGTQHWPAGMYVVRAGQWMEKLLVLRR